MTKHTIEYSGGARDLMDTVKELNLDIAVEFEYDHVDTMQYTLLGDEDHIKYFVHECLGL